MVQWGVVRCGSFVKRTVTRKRRKLNNFELPPVWSYGPRNCQFNWSPPYLLDNFLEFNHGKKLKMVTCWPKEAPKKKQQRSPMWSSRSNGVSRPRPIRVSTQKPLQYGKHQWRWLLHNKPWQEPCSSRHWTLQNKVMSGIGLPVAFFDASPPFLNLLYFLWLLQLLSTFLPTTSSFHGCFGEIRWT